MTDPTAWFTNYPKTHAKRGQSVEVVTRERYDGLGIALQEALRERDQTRDRLQAEIERLREFVVDLAEGWVGDVQSRAQKELRRG